MEFGCGKGVIGQGYLVLACFLCQYWDDLHIRIFFTLPIMRTSGFTPFNWCVRS